MLKEYLGDNTTKYILTSGSEVILTDEELNELIENSELVEDLKDELEDLKSDIESLKKDVTHYEKEVDSLNKEIAKLELEQQI